MTLPIKLPLRQDLSSPTAVVSIIRAGWEIKSKTDNYILYLQKNDTSADKILSVLGMMTNAAEALTKLKAAPGLDMTAQATIPGYTGSLSADTQAVIDAMLACVAWVLANVPKDSNGWVLAYKWNTDGTLNIRAFTPAQTAGLVAQLQTLRNMIG